jgi:hypothetical protein
MVIIGIDYDQGTLEKLLDDSLVTDAEWEQDFRDLVDPFEKYMVG